MTPVNDCVMRRIIECQPSHIFNHHLTPPKKTDNRPERVGSQSKDLTSLQTSFVSVFSIPQIQVSTQDVHSSIFPSFVSKQRNRILVVSFETSGEREGSLSSSLVELFLRFREEREKRIKTVCEPKNSLTEHSSSKLCETFQMISRTDYVESAGTKSNCSCL